MNCIACHQKIKISQVVITAPQGDICRSCVRDGWEFYETGNGLGLRQRALAERKENAIETKPPQPTLFDWLALQDEVARRGQYPEGCELQAEIK